MGAQPSEKLKDVLSAADLFVLATSNEGWANVFLEAMACGLPVVSTDVGGNAEVVCEDKLGTIVPFFDSKLFEQALLAALSNDWGHGDIVDYAKDNSWNSRVSVLKEEFCGLNAQ